MGEATGAAAIFGTTGGVMEAALRTAQDLLTGENLEKIDFEKVRGGDGRRNHAGCKRHEVQRSPGRTSG